MLKQPKLTSKKQPEKSPIPLDSLMPIEWNPRTISPDALRKLAASLNSHSAATPGWKEGDGIRLASPITVNRNGNRILGGHQRVAALRQTGQDWIHPDDICWRELPVDSPAEKALVISLNNKDASGDFVDELLETVLGDIEDSEFFSDLEFESLLANLEEEEPVEAGGGPGGTTVGTASLHKCSFTVTDEQLSSVVSALAAAKEMGDFVDTGNESQDGNALARVCELFLGSIKG